MCWCVGMEYDRRIYTPNDNLKPDQNSENISIRRGYIITGSLLFTLLAPYLLS